MPRRGTALTVCAGFAIALFVLYFYNLTAMGMFGPDEPRYAAIGREMARSGDWITPRLWGQPWFEKPALLYWMTGVATLAGLGADLAPRLPVATISAGFLLFFFAMARREFGLRPALYGSMILATSAGWITFSQVGVTDLPLAAAFSAALLLCMPWLRARDRTLLPAAAACLGLAVLAKGLVPLVLLAPLFWVGRKQARDLFHPVVLAVFAIVALPWYVLCWMRNGAPFLDVFFLQHQLGRFTSTALQHGQPGWFYLPDLLLLLFPWLFLLPLLFRRGLYDSPALRLMLCTLIWGLAFFSASANKLASYLLPLLPAAALLLGVATARARFAAGWLGGSIAAFALMPVIGWMLPIAMSEGMRHAYPVDDAVRGESALLMPLLLILGAMGVAADRRDRRMVPVAMVFCLTVASSLWLKASVMPKLDADVSARSLWREAAVRGEVVCAGTMDRTWRYGLDYYFEGRLHDCARGTAGLEIVQKGRRPVLERVRGAK